MPLRPSGLARASSKLGINVRGTNGVPALHLRGSLSTRATVRKGILNVLPLELLIRIFSFCESPRTFSGVCRIFYRIAQDPHGRAKWFVTHYGSKMAFYHALRSHRQAFNPEVGKFMLARGVDIPRFVVQYVVREYHQRRNSFGATPLGGGGQGVGQGGAGAAGAGAGADLMGDTNVYGESFVKHRSHVSTATYAFFVTHGYKLYDSNADFKEDDSVRFERLLYGTSVGTSTQTLEAIRNLILKFKFVPIKGTGSSLDETVYNLSKLDLSLVDHLFTNGLERTEELNDLVIERVLWRTDVTEASVRAYLSHGFKLTDPAIKKGLQMGRPATLTALRVHVPHTTLQKLAEDTVVEMLGPMSRAWTFTSEAIDFLRQSFPISDDVIERALYVRPPSIYAAAVALALSNGNPPPEKNIHEFPATRCYFKANPCPVWRWVLRAYGPRHPFTLACFDDALSRAAGDRELHALHDIFLDSGVRFRPRHVKILACRVLHRDMAANALHLIKVLRPQLTSHFRNSSPITPQNYLTPFVSRKTPEHSTSSSSKPIPSLPYFQYPEDMDEYGDPSEWVRLIKDEIVENREWIERMRTTQLEGGPRGGVYRVSRPPEEGIKFLDEAREIISELSPLLQSQNGTPSILQSMMGHGLRNSKKFADALGVVRRGSLGNMKDGGGANGGTPGAGAVSSQPSGNGKGSSTESSSPICTSDHSEVHAAAAFNDGVMSMNSAGIDGEVDDRLMEMVDVKHDSMESGRADPTAHLAFPSIPAMAMFGEGGQYVSIRSDVADEEVTDASPEEDADNIEDAHLGEVQGRSANQGGLEQIGGPRQDSDDRPGRVRHRDEKSDDPSWFGTALVRLFRLQGVVRNGVVSLRHAVINEEPEPSRTPSPLYYSVREDV